MSSTSWLPPLNSHFNYTTQVLLNQFRLPEDHGWPTDDQYFVIHIDVSVKFHSPAHLNPFEGLSLHKEFCAPCKGITDVPDSEGIEDLWLFLSSVRIPFNLKYIFLVQQHLDSHSTENSWEDDDEALMCKFHQFLQSVKGKPYNSNRHLLPVKLEINKIVEISDEEYCTWTSWYEEKIRVDPNFKKEYGMAIRRTRTLEELLYEASVLQELLYQVSVKSRRATKSSREALENVVLLDDSSSMADCVICLGKLQPKSKLIRLPCSHIFHGDCIMRWLEEKQTCPLCRSKLPSQCSV